VLFKLDRRSFLIAVADAQAQLAGAHLKVPALQAAYRQRKADEEAARTTLAYQQREFARQTQLPSGRHFLARSARPGQEQFSIR